MLMDGPIYMITTSDNPWNPFTQYDEWSAYDRQCGYKTERILAALTPDAPELSAAQNQYDINAAMDEMCNYQLTGSDAKYIKVTIDDFK